MMGGSVKREWITRVWWVESVFKPNINYSIIKSSFVFFMGEPF